MIDVVVLLIEKFGLKCCPQNFNRLGYTALIYACKNNMNEIAILLINKFGRLCSDKIICDHGNSALTYAKENNMLLVIKLIENLNSNVSLLQKIYSWF